MIRIILIITFVLSVDISYADVMCIAHRGYSAKYTENTMEAITHAWKAGASVVEIDVRMLKDGNIVLFHDEKIRKKYLTALTYEELQGLTPQSVPFLIDALAQLPKGRSLLLDLKTSSSGFIEKLLQVVLSSSVSAEKIWFQSKHIFVLEGIKKNMPQATCIYASRLKKVAGESPDAYELANELCKKGINGISSKGRKFINSSYIKAFKDKGLLFFVWTINKKGRLRHYLDLGVDGIITDNPERLSGLIKKWKGQILKRSVSSRMATLSQPTARKPQRNSVSLLSKHCRQSDGVSSKRIWRGKNVSEFRRVGVAR